MVKEGAQSVSSSIFLSTGHRGGLHRPDLDLRGPETRNVPHEQWRLIYPPLLLLYNDFTGRGNQLWRLSQVQDDLRHYLGVGYGGGFLCWSYYHIRECNYPWDGDDGVIVCILDGML